jgi:phasin family protein
MTTAKTAKTVAQDAAKTLQDYSAAGQHQMKEGMERSMAAMAEVGAFGKENVEALVASATAATKGLEAVSARAVAYSKTAMENHLAAAKAIMTSKSVQEVLERQAEYARSAFDGYVAEMGKMTELLSGVTKDAVKPINERVSAVSHLIQSGAAR